MLVNWNWGLNGKIFKWDLAVLAEWHQSQVEVSDFCINSKMCEINTCCLLYGFLGCFSSSSSLILIAPSGAWGCLVCFYRPVIGPWAIQGNNALESILHVSVTDTSLIIKLLNNNTINNNINSATVCNRYIIITILFLNNESTAIFQLKAIQWYLHFSLGEWIT